MSKQFEELWKDLATGMSRRKAFWRFFSGVGAMAAAVLSGRPATAAPGNGNNVCVESCRAQGFQGSVFGLCVSESAHCPPGQCAFAKHHHMNAGPPVFFCSPV